jgi:integrase/recombinase XerC
LTPSAVNTTIAALRNQNHHKSSLSHHIRAVKMFSRWLYRNGHIPSDPLVSVRVPTVAQSEKQIHRRALGKQEFETLVSIVESSGVAFGMTGTDRSMRYRIAGATGFRQGELRSLTLESFDL